MYRHYWMLAAAALACRNKAANDEVAADAAAETSAADTSAAETSAVETSPAETTSDDSSPADTPPVPDATPTGCVAGCDDADPATYDYCHVPSAACVHNDITYPIRSHTVDGRVYRWVIGQDWDVWGETGSLVTDAGPPWLEELVWGTDLGMSVRLGGRRIIYFGDTWRFEGGQRRTHRWCDAACTDDAPAANCAQCDDAIAFTSDDDPGDGLTLEEVPFQLEIGLDGAPIRRHLPIAIPGVHSDQRQQNIWGSPFNVPSGAVSFTDDSGEQVLLWYATAMLEDAGVRMRSWLGRTRDGTTFENCFPPPGGSGSGADRYLPFSAGPAPGGRFINVAAVEIGEYRLEGCDPPPFVADRGLLLYGTGTPYRRSSVYLAYAPLDRVCSTRCEGDDCAHRWVAYYTGGTGAACWSTDEGAAAPLLSSVVTVPAANGESAGIGELSVKAVPGLGLVMLSNEAWCARADGCAPGEYRKGVALRVAPGTRPWSFGALIATGAEGYGPYIIDGLARWTEETRTLGLWHLVSTWRGGNNTAYGVQLTRSDVVIP